MSDYEKGLNDGILGIANKIENEYRPIISDNLAEVFDTVMNE